MITNWAATDTNVMVAFSMKAIFFPLVMSEPHVPQPRYVRRRHSQSQRLTK